MYWLNPKPKINNVSDPLPSSSSPQPPQLSPAAQSLARIIAPALESIQGKKTSTSNFYYFGDTEEVAQLLADAMCKSGRIGGT